MKIIETARTILRTWDLTDAEEYLKIYGDEEIWKYIGPYKLNNIEEAKQSISKLINYQNEHGFCQWAVVEKNSMNVIGACGLGYFDGKKKLGVAFHFNKEYWGKGFATETTIACVNYAFEHLKVIELESLTDPHNISSQRVLEKSGFRLNGIEIGTDKTLSRVYIAINPNRKSKTNSNK